MMKRRDLLLGGLAGIGSATSGNAFTQSLQPEIRARTTAEWLEYFLTTLSTCREMKPKRSWLIQKIPASEFLSQLAELRRCDIPRHDPL